MFPVSNTTKSEKDPFIIYYPLDPVNYSDLLKLEKIRTLSIDPALKNFAVRIEDRYNDNTIKPVFFDKINFTKKGIPYSDLNKKGTEKINPELLWKITNYFNNLLPYIESCQVIGIERQMAINYKCTRVFQHLLSLFSFYIMTMKINSECILIDINPKLKGKVLAAPKGIDIKVWGVQKCKQLLQERGDDWSLKYLSKHEKSGKTKADDLADTVIQMEGWIRYIRKL